MRGWIVALMVVSVGLCGFLMLSLIALFWVLNPSSTAAPPAARQEPAGLPQQTLETYDEQIANDFRKLFIERRKPRRWITAETDPAKIEKANWDWTNSPDNKWLDIEAGVEIRRWACSSKERTIDKIVSDNGFKDRFRITGERTADGLWVEVTFVGTEKP